MSTRKRKTDLDLLRGLAGPDGDWEKFAAIYYPQAKRIAARQLKNPDAVQDVVQEVMMRLVRRFARGWEDDPEKGGFGAYLSWAIRNAVKSHFRALGRRQGREDKVPEDEDTEQLPGWESAGPASRKGRAWSPVQRKVVRLAAQELTAMELEVLTSDGKGRGLAEEFGKTTGAVRVQRHRARNHLRKALRERIMATGTVCRQTLAGRFAHEHLVWAGEMILDRGPEAVSEPTLLFRRPTTGRPVEAIPVAAGTEIGRDTFAALEAAVVDGEVSGRHCLFDRVGDGLWVVQDLGSTNGTWVNGNRLDEGETAALCDGDRLEIGTQLLVFSAGEQDSEEE